MRTLVHRCLFLLGTASPIVKMRQRLLIVGCGAWGLIVTMAWLAMFVNLGAVLRDVTNDDAHARAALFGFFACVTNSIPLFVVLATHVSACLERLPSSEQKLVRRHGLCHTFILGHAFLALFVFTVDRLHAGPAVWLLVAALLVCSANAVTIVHALVLSRRSSNAVERHTLYY